LVGPYARREINHSRYIVKNREGRAQYGSTCCKPPAYCCTGGFVAALVGEHNHIRFLQPGQRLFVFEISRNHRQMFPDAELINQRVATCFLLIGSCDGVEGVHQQQVQIVIRLGKGGERLNKFGQALVWQQKSVGCNHCLVGQIWLCLLRGQLGSQCRHNPVGEEGGIRHQAHIFQAIEIGQRMYQQAGTGCQLGLNAAQGHKIPIPPNVGTGV